MRLLAVLFMLLSVACSKICWEECDSYNLMHTADVIGCRRRSAYPRSQGFTCQGMDGPPCTVKQGDRVRLNLSFANPGLQNVSQSVVWVTGWGLDMPWVGMDTQVCPYLDGGQGCQQQPVGEGRISNFDFPIDIQSFFPTGRYQLRWSFNEETEDGAEEKLCFSFKIRIV